MISFWRPHPETQVPVLLSLRLSRHHVATDG